MDSKMSTKFSSRLRALLLVRRWGTCARCCASLRWAARAARRPRACCWRCCRRRRAPQRPTPAAPSLPAWRRSPHGSSTLRRAHWARASAAELSCAWSAEWCSARRGGQAGKCMAVRVGGDAGSTEQMYQGPQPTACRPSGCVLREAFVLAAWRALAEAQKKQGHAASSAPTCHCRAETKLVHAAPAPG